MRLARKFFAAALIGVAIILTMPVASDAHHCSGNVDLLDDGGVAEGECHKGTPGRRGAFVESNPKDEWDRFCSSQMDGASGVAYVDGAYITVDDQGQLGESRVETLNYDPTGSYGSFVVFCFHPHGAASSGFGGEFIYTITDPVPLVDLRAAAKAKLVIADPVIETNPSFTDRFTLVNIETWLWADPAYWVEQSADETAGFVTVEVFARPNSMTWSFSDGTSTVCNGPGLAWTPGATTADCGVTFAQSSAGETNDAFQGDATVDWIFSWSLNNIPQGDFDAPYLATTNLELQVGEIQAVGS